MSLQLYGVLKSRLLAGGFQAQTIYLSVPKPAGTSGGTSLESVQVNFQSDTLDTIVVYESSQFAIMAGTNLDRMFISNVPLTVSSANGAAVDVIELEGDEAKVYAVNGIYLINRLTINLKEGVW